MEIFFKYDQLEELFSLQDPHVASRQKMSSQHLTIFAVSKIYT